MPRLIASFILALIPVALFAAPVPKEKNRYVDLIGTTWLSEGETGFGVTTYKFEKDGVLEYRYGGNVWRNSTWKQDGVNFTYELNSSYYVYKGEIEGEVITGKATNKPGGHWEYKLKRVYEK